MKEKVVNGENIELDGVIIDNKTSIEETVQKEDEKEETKVEVDEAPKAEENNVEQEEPPKQEEAPAVNTEPEPTPETKVEPEVTNEIPTVSIPPVSNEPTPEVPVYTPTYTQEPEPVVQPDTPETTSTTTEPVMDNTYSAVYVPTDVSINNQTDYSQMVPPSSQFNTFDAENFKNEIMSCVEKNVTVPFDKMNDAMIRAKGILAKVKEQGYVTGSDHNVMEALINEINSLTETSTVTSQYEMNPNPDYGIGMKF